MNQFCLRCGESIKAKIFTDSRNITSISYNCHCNFWWSHKMYMAGYRMLDYETIQFKAKDMWIEACSLDPKSDAEFGIPQGCLFVGTEKEVK